jgi:hypothetical protein
MNSKDTLVRFLLLAYLPCWRLEYGQELASLLSHSKLGVKTAADVLSSGFAERLRSDSPGKLSGLALFLITVAFSLSNSIKPLTPGSYAHAMSVFSLGAFLAGCWTAIRERTTIRKAMIAGIQAGFAGLVPDLATGFLWLFGILHPIVLRPDATVKIPGHLFTLWFVRTDANLDAIGFLCSLLLVALAQTALLGLAGGCLGAFLRRVTTGYRPT